jgi:hypothetical protein
MPYKINWEENGVVIQFSGIFDFEVNKIKKLDSLLTNFSYIMDGWNCIVRFYRLRKAIQDGTYKFPELKPVKAVGRREIAS